jgi:hypothetical protein
MAIPSCGLVLVLDSHRWPIASLLLAAACFAIWGLIAHRDPAGGLLLRLAQHTVAAVGAVAIVCGLLGILFWALGPAPIL